MPTIHDLVTELEEIEPDAVVDVQDDEWTFIVIDTTALDADEKDAVQALFDRTRGWHLDDRARKDETWRGKPH